MEVSVEKFEALTKSLSSVYPDLKSIVDSKVIIDGEEVDLFELKNKDQIYISMFNLYNLVPWLKTGVSVSDFNDYLGSQKWKNRKQLIRGLPIFKEENLSLDSFYKTFKDGGDEDEGLQCIFCGSRRTRTIEKQIRKADEGATVFTKCYKCGKLHRQS
jgi:DNA-directed RNA polymerase subunit M/transcription elongation factor TFIIS